MQPHCDDYFRAVDTPRAATPSLLNEGVRGYLDASHAWLLERHDAGDPASFVNEAHSDLIDRLIRKLFRLVENRYFEENARLTGYRIAVVAVGGTGRRELSLGSDIDLLFLHKGKLNPYVETMTEGISHRLWDGRLQVGAAVRTVPECLRIGRSDLPTLTSYLDARFLIGDTGLFGDFERRVEREVRGDARGFIESKLEERRRRRERFGESAYLLQPNVRESVGGLRDYHTALWVARAARWDVRRAEHLLIQGFLDATELEQLLGALELLWRIRNELHRSGRKDDRLHFEAQERVAAHLGFTGGDHELPIEQLMRSYYESARAVERACDRVCEHAVELTRSRRRRREPRARPIEEGFAVVGHHLEIPSESLLRERPVRMLSAFALAQEHEVELSPRAQRMVRENTGLIDDALRKDGEAAALLRRILQGAERVYRTLIAMNELGVLGAYLPEFAHLVGRWQHDLYHTYTVDVHSLFLVEQLRRLVKGYNATELPLATELMREVSDPTVLFLGCILHDIGKGRGGGHSAKGAALVPEVCRRLGLDETESDRVHFVVLHHLTMSAMAERRDVHDARVILNLARIVGSRSRLRDLYLATVADIRSVSAEAWTPWKGGLLEALYRNTAEWLETGAGDESAEGFFLQRTMARAERVEREATALLVSRNFPEEEVRTFLAAMPRRYALSHGSSEIAEHVAAVLAHVASEHAVSVARFDPQADADPFTGFVVLAPDRPRLLATATGVLRTCGHDVLGAQIYTARDGLAVQIWEVAPLPADPEVLEAERERLERRLRSVIEQGRSVDDLIASTARRHPGVGRSRPPQIRITNDESDFYTIIDIAATDRGGLLHDLASALADVDVDVVMSRVATRASRVNDAFYVTDQTGAKILDPERQEEIRQRLLQAIGGAAA